MANENLAFSISGQSSAVSMLHMQASIIDTYLHPQGLG